ncbi:GNAT family N-acetyltransferase [Devriesea agamarum]|uniref:GNAT family N-acetyltransferase n=1 Tax=Devriesea agamarum TaxID=472569 RepID=UPI00071CB2F0|nr:GNAT family N-acetyltransferase [Devriesea agamarum]
MPVHQTVPKTAPRSDASGDVVLRPASWADLDQLSQLEQVLFPDEAWDLSMLLQEIGHPARRYVIACPAHDVDTVIGYAGIMLGPDEAEIHTIGTVQPGRGIGTRLLDWCALTAQQAGAQRIFLEVREDNARARTFYRSHGWGEIWIRRGYYRTPCGPVDAVVMALDLPPMNPTD